MSLKHPDEAGKYTATFHGYVLPVDAYFKTGKGIINADYRVEIAYDPVRKMWDATIPGYGGPLVRGCKTSAHAKSVVASTFSKQTTQWEPTHTKEAMHG